MFLKSGRRHGARDHAGGHKIMQVFWHLQRDDATMCGRGEDLLQQQVSEACIFRATTHHSDGVDIRLKLIMEAAEGHFL